MSSPQRVFARHAAVALDAYPDSETGDPVADLIADLGHWCDEQGLDFLDKAKRGISHWHAEQGELAGVAPLPAVRIRISAPRV